MIKDLINELSSINYNVKYLEFRLKENNLKVNGKRIQFFGSDLEFDENRGSMSVPYESVKIVFEKKIDNGKYSIGDIYYKDGIIYIPKDGFPSDLEKAIIDLGINVKKVSEDKIDEIFYC